MMKMLESLRSGFQSAETARLNRESMDERSRLGREAKAEKGRLNRESRERIARSAKGKKSLATITEATSQWKPEHQALAHYNFNELLANLPEGTSFEDLSEQQAARLTNGALDAASDGIDLSKSPEPLTQVLSSATGVVRAGALGGGGVIRWLPLPRRGIVCTITVLEDEFVY